MITAIFKRGLVFLAFVLIGPSLFAQPNVMPPSPNAAAFSKYGNIPVSLYTGVPQINIPLYEIRVRDIQVPISLTYHASGIRVGEEASRIGLGWVLNAGGVISRNIVYLDDFQDFPQAFLASNNTSDPIKQGPNSAPVSLTQMGVVYTYFDLASGSTPQQEDLSPWIVKQGIDPLWKPTDFEPDQFSYNFLGKAGRFVLNKGRDVILEKQEKIRILPNGDGSAWTVTTSDGFIYKFNDSEFLIDTDNTPGYQQKTAWYLSEIISPQNEHVYFNYVSLGQQQIVPIGTVHQEKYPRVISCENFVCRQRNQKENVLDGKQYSNIFLESITWSHGKVKFNVANDRQDIVGDIRITSMQIFKKNALEPFQEIIFSHDYFVSPPVDPISIYEYHTGRPEQERRRLKLTAISKRALPMADSEPEKYSFTYYEPNYYPGKNSYSRDHWGYFNGKANTSLIPDYRTVLTGTPTLNDYLGIMGSNRDASSSNHAEALTLKSITYPTKGTTTFFFEPNTYHVYPDDGGGQEPEAFPDTKGLSYNASIKGEQVTQLDLRDQYVNLEGNTTPIIVRGGFRTVGDCSALSGAPNVYFEVYPESNPQATVGRVSPNGTRICANPESPECSAGCLICCQGSGFIDYVGSISLPPGIYYIRAFMSTDEGQIQDITAYYTYMVDPTKRAEFGYEADGSIKKYRNGGGIRVRRIEDYDPVSRKISNVKEYKYGFKVTNEDGLKESYSYGKRMVKPEYSYFDVTWEEIVHTHPDGGQVISKSTCFECLTVVRDSGHPLANYDGNSVGYDRVIEYHGENKENGYTEFEFDNFADIARTYTYPYAPQKNIPIRPPFSNVVKDPRNGNLKRQTHFSAAGKKIMSTENTYVANYKNIMYGLSSRQIPIDPGVSEQTAAYQQILLLYESMNSNFSFLSETTTTSFLPNEEEGTKTSVKYEYNDPDHLQLTRVIKLESDLHKTITEYKYPADYTDIQATPAILAMKGNKFMHSLPVETTIIDESPDGTVKKVKHHEINVYENFNNLTFPKEKVLLQNSAALPIASVPDYVPANSYDANNYRKSYRLDYNADGNLKLIQKSDDSPVAFLWDASQTLPIAEIRNSTSDASFFTSFEDDGDIFTDVFGNAARTGSKVKNVTTFTFPTAYAPVETNTLMSYWYWQNNRWNFSGLIPFQRTFTVPGGKLDEVRAMPKDAQMSTYTYDPMFGMTSKTDINNTTTYYEYDNLGRLKTVRDDDKNIVKKYDYNFMKQ